MSKRMAFGGLRDGFILIGWSCNKWELLRGHDDGFRGSLLGYLGNLIALYLSIVAVHG